MKKLNFSCYLIEIIGLVRNYKTLSVELKILKKGLYSREKSKLLNYLMKVDINGKIDAGVQFAAGLKPAVQVAVSASVGIRLVANLAGLWSLINTIQLITYMPINAVPYSERLRDTSTALINYNVIPNVMALFCDEEATSRPSKQLKDFGIESSVMLINVGPIWMIFIYCLISTIFYLVLAAVFKDSVKIQKFKTKYKFNLMIRFWIESYLELGIYALIQVKSV